MAIVLIVLGNRTFYACPNCKGQQLSQWTGQPTPENHAIWTSAKEADERAFKRNKLTLLAVVMAMFAAALVFMFVMMQNL